MFEGDHDHNKASLWFQKIEEICEVLHYTGETKMNDVTFCWLGKQSGGGEALKA